MRTFWWDQHFAEYSDFNEETRVSRGIPTARGTTGLPLPPADGARSHNSALLRRLLYSFCPYRTRSHSRSDKEFGRKGFSTKLVYIVVISLGSCNTDISMLIMKLLVNRNWSIEIKPEVLFITSHSLYVNVDYFLVIPLQVPESRKYDSSTEGVGGGQRQR